MSSIPSWKQVLAGIKSIFTASKNRSNSISHKTTMTHRKLRIPDLPSNKSFSQKQRSREEMLVD
ncbi:MAG: hypothetical protein QM726_10185 [Chitinophagaceae bacterium]